LGPKGPKVSSGSRSKGYILPDETVITDFGKSVNHDVSLMSKHEPPTDSPLLDAPNTLLTPHLGGHTLESHVAMQDCVMANLEAYFAGKPLPYGVKLA
jgi:hypothetical protein